MELVFLFFVVENEHTGFFSLQCQRGEKPEKRNRYLLAA